MSEDGMDLTPAEVAALDAELNAPPRVLPSLARRLRERAAAEREARMWGEL